ncbi:hypothetical protein PIB30_113670, partial [Stylosanthes scabra]|nr:hypothetical protein [Stylosanthes scabra]
MPVAVANPFFYQKMQIKTDQNVSMMFSYHRGIGGVFEIELCVQLQDVGGSSSSSNNVDSGRGIDANEGTHMPPNRRAGSPSFRPYINQSVHAPSPAVAAFEDDVQPGMMESPDRDDYQPRGSTLTTVKMR